MRVQVAAVAAVAAGPHMTAGQHRGCYNHGSVAAAHIIDQKSSGVATPGGRKILALAKYAAQKKTDRAAKEEGRGRK